MPAGKIFQDCWAVVADRGQLQSLRFESLLRGLQLHELRFAEGSPISRPKEDQHGTVCALERLIGLFPAELIRQSKFGSLLADF